ncbi:MAG TPA: VOC family protein [Polyangiales bacterium]|nr:VOC family protein [Polyangiales bacterium]
MLTAFDHVTIAVNDLDAAAAAHEQLLGDAPCWRGEHPELGTRAALFALENSLIELVGPRPDAVEAEGLRALLAARGEGLQALAWRTADATACHAELRARGLRAAPPRDGSAHAPDGSTRRFRVVELSPRATRGLSVLAVERVDPAPARGAPAAASCVHALDHVVVRTAAPDAAIALYRDALGIRLALDAPLRNTRMLFFRTGGVTLEVVQDATLQDHDTFYGLAYRVRDLDAAHARLRAAGMAVGDPHDGLKPGTRVFRVHDALHGVPTLVLHDPSRS